MMRVLIGNEWRDGFLDHHCGPGECRLQVARWITLEKISGMYFVREKSLRMLWNYFLEIGLRAVLRKIRSRMRERFRNEKAIACGIGRVIESPPPGSRAGNPLVFIAPCHPLCLERVVIPWDLTSPLDEHDLSPFSEGIQFADLTGEMAQDCWWAPLRGWSPFSGAPLPRESCDVILRKAHACLREIPWGSAKRFETASDFTIRDRSEPIVQPRSRAMTGVLFGFGNYAKTVILPNLSRFLDITSIHEVDPLQIPLVSANRVRWDTSPGVRPEDEYDVYVFGSYHHTHAPLAVEALRRNACALSEKPIATDNDQLSQLLEALGSSRGRYFCGFQRRYSPFNEFAREDLRSAPGEPISYHCIVFEEPLPPLHWYGWPNSKSRLTSNGCHWIDHFLYLNSYAEPLSHDLAVAPDGTIICSLCLKNDAFFTMVLTDRGSRRIGMQDYIELRSRDVTVKITNSSTYVAEGADRILRKRRMSKMASYHRMYREIGKRIACNEPGDSVESVRISGETVLRFEDLLNLRLKKAARPC
ncbi:MAG: Gfo/Idh/MocA family protein [Gemmataceae bacterium]